jgi:phage terminase large subunit
LGVEVLAFISTTAEITSRAGAQIPFEGLRSNVTSLQSLEAIDVAWIEEAQSVSQNSLDVLYPTLRTDGSEIWASWNPRNPTDPIDRPAPRSGSARWPWRGSYAERL